MRHHFKKLLFILLAVGVSPALLADCCGSNTSCSTSRCDAKTNITGHTFFPVRSQYHLASPELITLFRGDRARKKEDGYGGAFQFTVFGGKSTNADQLAQYFMPFGKTELIAGEFGSNAVQTNSADVIANYFGVLTAANGAGANTFDMTGGTFESKISFRPRQSVFGLGFSWRHSFANECDQGWFIFASTPIERVRNELAFKEKIINAGGGQSFTGFVTNMTAAFCGQPVLNFGPVSGAQLLTFPGGTNSFKYGKIDCNGSCSNRSTVSSRNRGCCDGASSGECNSRIKWGLADIELNVGYEWFGDEDAYSELWAGIVIPTGNKPTGEFIFEPIVGNNKHFAFAAGGSYGYEFWRSEDCERSFWIELNTAGHIYCSNTQKRSFDLIDKQWSRYMWVYASSAATPFAGIQPGINFFTQDMRINPRFDVNYNTAFMYTTPCWEVEAGYNFYVRAAEDARLCNPNVLNGVGLVGFPIGDIDNPLVFTASNSTIRRFQGTQAENVFDSNFQTAVGQYLPIQPQDINLASAAAPSALTHTFYGSLGYNWDNCDYPSFVGLGGSYEYSANNAGLDRWLVWGKIGFSY